MKDQYFKKTQFMRKYIFMIFYMTCYVRSIIKLSVVTRLYFNDTTK